jgi:hypothetical protein
MIGNDQVNGTNRVVQRAKLQSGIVRARIDRTGQGLTIGRARRAQGQ